MPQLPTWIKNKGAAARRAKPFCLACFLLSYLTGIRRCLQRATQRPLWICLSASGADKDVRPNLYAQIEFVTAVAAGWGTATGFCRAQKLLQCLRVDKDVFD